MLLVEQLVEKALVHADSCYLMSTGRIVHEGLAKDLAGSDVLHSAYPGRRDIVSARTGAQAAGPVTLTAHVPR